MYFLLLVLICICHGLFVYTSYSKGGLIVSVVDVTTGWAGRKVDVKLIEIFIGVVF